MPKLRSLGRAPASETPNTSSTASSSNATPPRQRREVSIGGSVECEHLLRNEGSGLGSLFAQLEWSAADHQRDPDAWSDAPQALTTVALTFESSSAGIERELLCDAIRHSGAVARIAALVAHPEQMTYQAALMFLAKLLGPEHDRAAHKTRTLLKARQPPIATTVGARLLSNSTHTVLQAALVLRHICDDLTQVRAMYDVGAIQRLRDLTRCDQPAVAEAAAACMAVIVNNVKESNVTTIVLRVVVKLQARVRLRQARVRAEQERQKAEERQHAAIRIQAWWRASRARRWSASLLGARRRLELLGDLGQAPAAAPAAF